MQTTRSAGGIVINTEGKVLVTSQNGDSWSLPKGIVENGEDDLDTAKREIAEETGITSLTLIRELGSYDRYRIGKGGKGEDTSHRKQITVFLFTTDQDKLQPTDPHNPEARWLKPEEVSALLTHPADKEFFDSQLSLLSDSFPRSHHYKRRLAKVLGLVIIIAILGGTTWYVRSSENITTPLKDIKVEFSDDPVIVAVGDIACDPKSPFYKSGLGDEQNCQMSRTAQLASKLGPDTVLVLGDNQYEKGEFANYTQSYEPTWGIFKAITKPVPGNHEYYTPGASGYYQYFGAVARKDNNGYYSFSSGKWHIIALNSNCAEIGGCDTNSPQYKWLEKDLKDNQTKCTLAYWHHPRFSSGDHGNDPITQDFWNLLYASGVDVVLNGHDHIYERFAQQNPLGQPDTKGIAQFTVGTGGKNLTPIKQIQPNSAIRSADKFGVLRLTLHEGSYSWRFVTTGNEQLDIGSNPCH